MNTKLMQKLIVLRDNLKASNLREVLFDTSS